MKPSLSQRGNLHREGKGGTQRNISQTVLKQFPFVVAPLAEQIRITDALDELFSDLDAGVVALERARAKLSQYRASVLKAAVEGTLTAQWRQQHPHTERASELLKRILAARCRWWEDEQLRRFKGKAQEPPEDWRAKYKEPVTPDTTKLPPLPGGWCWATVDSLIVEPIINGISVRGSAEPPGIPALRLNAMSDRGFDYNAKRYLPLLEAQVSDLWIEPGDFFVSRGNGSKKLVGRGTPAQKTPHPIVFPDLMMRLRFVRTVRETAWISTIWGSGIVRLSN